MTRTVVITGISGQQPSALAEAFDRRGWRVRGTGREGGRSVHGETASADLETGRGLREAFEGADVVAFTLPQDHRSGAMPAMGRQVADAAAQAGVRRVVLNLAGTIDEGSGLPFFADLRAVRAAIREGATPSVVLQPTSYMDNLLAPYALPGIAGEGILAYPAPEDAAISWISHRSLADFVVAAAERDEAVGGAFHIGGPEALTGADLAARLSERIGRAITYRRIPLEPFAQGLNAAFGSPAGDRIASIYARLETEPRAMDVGTAAAEALGVEPERFDDFAGRHDWTPTSASRR